MPVTSKSNLITGRLIKAGVNNAVNSQPLATIESNIAKALLSEKSLTTSIADYTDITGMTTLGFSSAGKYLSSSFDSENIDVTTADDIPYRNIIVAGRYVSNEDVTPNGETTNVVKINASTTTTVTNKVLDDSSAYKNASVRTTIYDPYFSGTTFGDVNSNYTCSFDTSQANKLIYTRNVNANSAHTDGSSTITASEYTDWNTQDGYGSYFINGSVSFEANTGKPIASLYNASDSLNLLTKNFVVDLKTDISNVVPIFGRYHVTFSQGVGSSVTVDTTGNHNLVLTTDISSWDSFITNLNASVPLTELPSSILSTELTQWVLPTSAVSNGFTLELASSAFNASLSLVENANYNAPFDFNLNNMDFSVKAMYILEKSMETNASAGSSTLTNPTINGTTYTNRLTIVNGSLSLEQTNDVVSGYIQLLDGDENLGSSDYNTNGVINVYNSARVSTSSDAGSIYPRATRASVSSTSGILDHFAVQYKSNESGYQSSVGLLGGADLTDNNVFYEVSTMVGQTTTLEGSDNWTNVIDVNNAALAIVRDTNPSISKNDIVFYSNTNTYANNNDNQLSVIDIVCNKSWSESKVYDSDDVPIDGITVDITSTNMSEVNFNLKDIRVALTTKTLSDLTLSSSDTNWSITCPDSYIKTSVGKMGVIDDSTIVDLLLNGSDSTQDQINILLKPSVDSVLAHKFTKFHNQIEITYQNAKQITYDDEFEVLNYVKSAISSTLVDPAPYTGIRENSKLYLRSYTESFTVKIPFRFGNISNLFLTSPLISQTVSYYVLTDDKNNDHELPRYFLNGIINPSTEASLFATINSTNFVTDVTFSYSDFKTFKIRLEEKTSGSWSPVYPNPVVDCDLWYNTQSVLASTIGTFNFALTLSPNITSMTRQSFYVDMELEKGITSFSISGKNFTESQIDAMNSIDLNTFNLSSSSGTAITGLGDVTYSNDSDANPNTQATTTLTAAGYTFKLAGELYLSIRIFVCPNGMFRCVKTGGANSGTTFPNIEVIGGEYSLKLATGIYAYGNLRAAIRNTSSATWGLNNDAISATYYGSTGFSTSRITSLNQEFRPSAGKRGFKTNLLRGLTLNTSTNISRTQGTYLLKLAGYEVSGGLNTSINSTIFGSIEIDVNSNIRSMYASNFGTQSWNINLTYGSYTLSDTIDSFSEPIDSTVESFRPLISSRRGIKILSYSLNTNTFTYIIQYISSNTLSVRRHPNIDAQDYSVNNTGYNYVTEFTPENLRDDTKDNLIGNILKVHYTAPGTIPDITCQFSISPPYLKFTALNPTNVSTIPFNSNIVTPVTRYLRVQNSTNNYYPFSAHDTINNIKFVHNNMRQYLEYLNDSNSSPKYMNVDNYKIKVELGSGLNSLSSVTDWVTFYDDIVLNNGYTDDSITITAPDSARKIQISLNQHLHPAFSSFFVYSENFSEYNLQIEIGSSFISGPSNGSNSTVLEFIAGDCTKLDMYAIRKFETDTSANTLSVTFVKYSSGQDGISNQFLNASTAYGFSMPYINVYTKTISTQLYVNAPVTSPKRTFWDILESLKSSITTSTFNSWTSENAGTSPVKLNLIPANITGADKIVNSFTLTPNVPLVLLVLQLEDYDRLEDIYKVANTRRRYNGKIETSTIVLYPKVE